jgi:hypothetical protein
VVMSSRAEYSGYTVYPKSFRVSHKSAGRPPSSRQFKWVHACAPTFTDPEADIWNKWHMLEPEANMRTELSSHDYKGMLPIQIITKDFRLSPDLQLENGNWIINLVKFRAAISIRCKICQNSNWVRIKWWRKVLGLWIKNP